MPRRDVRRAEWEAVYYKSKEREGQVKLEDEPQEKEVEKVAIVLDELYDFGMIGSTFYDLEKFARFRDLVHENFFVFWTAINPPMERLLYALSAIIRPRNIIGIGIFTGNPVVWSMGPALDGTYTPERLVAVEIDKNNARLCQENFDQLNLEITPGFPVKVFPMDGFVVLENEYKDGEIDLLYLDANGTDPETGISGKRINYTFLKRAYPRLKPGGYAMCHNATMESFKKEAGDYLRLTENEEFFAKTSGIYIDEMGLEISLKK